VGACQEPAPAPIPKIDDIDDIVDIDDISEVSEPRATVPVRLRDELADVWRCALVATAVFAGVEITATLIAGALAPGDLPIGSTLRFVVLGVVLAGLALPLIGLALSGAAIAARLGLRLADRERSRTWPGLFAPLDAGPRPATAWLWGLALGALMFVAASTAATIYTVPRFVDLPLTGVLLGLAQLAALVVALFATLAIRAAAARLGAALDGRLGRVAAVNPLTRPLAGLAAIAAIAAAALIAVALASPRLAPVIPWRLLLALCALVAGAVLGRRLAGRGLRLPPRRTLAAAIAGFYAVLVPITLVWWGAHSGAKALAVTSSPAFAALVDGVRRANDVDGDGFGSLLGETDCAPFDASRNPLAPEIPDNGIDENCDGRDLELARLELEPGETPPVPEAFRRDWNFLLLTVDTVRYDHTSFGGYERDTTPELARLVERSVSFAFCNAPSAGTMASIPATLTSKFFHSGIALGPNRRGMPPLTRPENLLLSEALQANGYRTGALLTHYYFNDWGLDQGFDTYDNSLGRKNNPKVVSADRLTDRAVAWIGRNARRKWFLWAHYIDPHGHYVDHPGGVSYGDSEKDRYDGELHFTDKHVGRLLQEISRISGVAENTVVIVTSDHGDGFNEHGFTSHAKALYFELLHVPLIVYIPSIQPRVVPGPTSPLDIFPTVLDLAGIDRSRLSFEGRSLVPQLFYGADARDRVVFAETDYPKPQRAAISDRYKLIRRLQDDLYELYDLKKDPREQVNLYPPRNAQSRGAFAEMNGHLERWLERVYYARDRQSNQLMMYLADVLLPGAPSPSRAIEGASFDGGRIEVLGFDVEPASSRPGQKVDVSVYFKATAAPTADYKLQLTAADGDSSPQRTRAAFTSDGRFPTSRWRAGEYIRDTRTMRLRSDLEGEVELGLRLLTGPSQPVPPDAGPTLAKDSNALKLGTLQVGEPERGRDAAPVP
jgi:arylsulfatase A-like enzyme